METNELNGTISFEFNRNLTEDELKSMAAAIEDIIDKAFENSELLIQTTYIVEFSLPVKLE